MLIDASVVRIDGMVLVDEVVAEVEESVDLRPPERSDRLPSGRGHW